MNDHFFSDTTKDEKWLVLVGRPSLAAQAVGGRGRPPHCTEARPTETRRARLTRHSWCVERTLRREFTFLNAD